MNRITSFLNQHSWPVYRGSLENYSESEQSQLKTLHAANLILLDLNAWFYQVSALILENARANRVDSSRIPIPSLEGLMEGQFKKEDYFYNCLQQLQFSSQDLVDLKDSILEAQKSEKKAVALRWEQELFNQVVHLSQALNHLSSNPIS
jgi:hypothetical protein